MKLYPFSDSFHPDTNEIILECFVTGNPTPEISWYRDNFEITTTDKFALISDNKLRKLIISHPDSSDSGLYSCKLCNNEQQQEVSCHVDVNSLIGIPKPKKEPKPEIAEEDLLQRKKPLQKEKVLEEVKKPQSRAERMRNEEKNKLVFEVYLKNVTANEGSMVKLMCCVRGHEPRVTWRRNGQEIPLDATKYSTESRNGIFSLTIKNVTHSDAGEYSCRIENAINTIYSSSKVIVNEKVQAKELPIVLSDKLLGQ